MAVVAWNAFQSQRVLFIFTNMDERTLDFEDRIHFMENLKSSKD